MPDIIDEVLQYDPGRKKEVSPESREAIIQEVLKFDPGRVGGTYQQAKDLYTPEGEPGSVYVKGEEPSAGFGTLIKAGFANDPQTIKEIYAKARGIPVSQYKIHNGEVLFRFKDKSGKWQWQRETGEIATSILKRGVAQTISNPAVIAGTVGSIVGGPLVGAATAAGGELARQAIGAGAYGDFGTEGWFSFSNLGKTLGEGILALAGGGGGTAIKASILGSRMKKTGLKMGAQALRFTKIAPKDHVKAQFMHELAQQFDIDLPLHQAYNKESLANMWMYLRKHPTTSDVIKEVETQLGKQSDDALQKFVKMLSPKRRSSLELGERAKELATETIKGEEAGRQVAVMPLYSKAFQEADAAGGVDIASAIKAISQTSKQYPEGSSKKALLRIQKSFMTESPDKTGKLITKPETDLRKIQKAMFDLNDLIEGTSHEAVQISPSSKNVLNRDLMGIKSKILEDIHPAAPTFMEANARFAELSEPIEALKKGIIGELSRLTKDKTTAEASRKLFTVGGVGDVELLRRAKASIEPQDPKAWRDLIADYIHREYEGIIAAEPEDLLAAIGKFEWKVFGSPRQRDIIKAAMPKKLYEQFDGLMKVAKRAQIGTRGQSMTQQFQRMEREIEGVSGSALYTAATEPQRFMGGKLFGWWNDILVAGRQAELLEAMLDPAAVKKLSQLRQLTPGSQKLINGLAEYGALISTKIGLEDIGSQLPGEQ